MAGRKGELFQIFVCPLQFHVQPLRLLRQFMLTHRTYYQCLIHAGRLLKKGPGLCHLNHYSNAAAIGGKNWPHDIRPIVTMGIGIFLAGVDFGLSGLVNPVKKRQIFLSCWRGAGERISDQIFPGFTDEEAKGGVDIADDVIGALHRSHRHGRRLGDRPAESRQVGFLLRLDCYLRLHPFLPFGCVSVGSISFGAQRAREEFR